jgi:hypothetical protein
MRVILQRVSQASVTVEGTVISKITHGFLILLGIEEADGPDDFTPSASPRSRNKRNGTSGRKACEGTSEKYSPASESGALSRAGDTPWD